MRAIFKYEEQGIWNFVYTITNATKMRPHKLFYQFKRTNHIVTKHEMYAVEQLDLREDF